MRVPAYSCQYHHERGSVVCPVSVHQPVDEVDSALVGYLQEQVLRRRALKRAIDEVKAEVERLMSHTGQDKERIDDELTRLHRQRQTS